MSRLGIAVVTYNRLPLVRRTIERIRQHTKHEFELVVADDGSGDGTAEALRAAGCRVISGPNMGVCWNKNRGLFFLKEVAKCDVVLMIEDDTYPIKDSWEDVWLNASERYGHIGLAGDWFRASFVSGAGTLAEPYVSPDISGQCEGFSRESLAFVGYLDTRFKGYGVGHAEHSMRFLRAGYGGTFSRPRDGREQYGFYLISADLKVEDPAENRSQEQAARNHAVLNELKGEKVHRCAWNTDAEMEQFRREIDRASTV
jgi:glycosyltransferase involved in cell wall biosynthesis